MSKPKYTAEQVTQALRKSNGIIAQAARELGCERQTVYNYISRYATVKAAYEEAVESTLDMAEAKLLEQIEAGDPQQVRFYLRTKGKHRGYTERTKDREEDQPYVVFNWPDQR